MASNRIAQNFRLSSNNSSISNDLALVSLETGTKILDGTGKEYIKVDSNIFDLVDRDFVTHDELPIDRIGQIAFKDEENTFIKTNTFRDIIPSSSNTYSVGSDSKKWGNLYSTKVTINGISVEKLSSSSENTSLYLPKVTGDYVHTIAQGNKDGLGNANKAVYLASNGELKECTNSIDVFKASGTNAKEGIVPKPSTTAGTSKFLREDATWSDLPVATASALGVVKVGNYINVSSGKISVDQASTTDYGVVKVGHALKIGSNGTLGVDEESLNIPDQDRIAYVDRENTFIENNNFDNILPNSNNTYNLGDTNKKWNKVYTNTLNLSGSDVTIENGSTSTSGAVGNASTPVYIDANGIPRACNISSMVGAAVSDYIASGFLWDITKVGCLRLVLIASRAHVSGLSGTNPLMYRVGDIIDLNKIDVYQAGLFFQLSNDDVQYSFPDGVIDPVGGDGGHSISAIDKYTSSKITAGTWRLLSPYFSADSGTSSDIGGARLCLIVRVA